MAVSTQCDDCRKDMTGDETICRSCVEEKNTEISELKDKLMDVESERDDFASQIEDMGKLKED